MRYYSFSIVTYLPLSSVDFFCRSYCLKFAYIFHDRDVSVPHFHVLCSFSQQKSVNSVLSLLSSLSDTSVNSFCEPLKDRFSAFRYLTHEGCPDKFQYSSSDIVSNDLAHYTLSSKISDNFEFINDLVSLSPRDLALKYGRDFIRNYKSYMFFRSLLLDS